MFGGWGERLKKAGMILSIIFMIPFFIFLIYSFIPTRLLNEKDMKRDFDYLRDLVIEAYIDGKKVDDFERAWNYNLRRIRGKLPRMEFYKIVARTISVLDDDSVGVSFGVPKYMPVMPFEVFPSDDRLFVIKSAIDEIPECSEVLEVNGEKEKDLIERLESYVSSDTEKLKYLKISKLFHLLPTLDREEKYSVVLKTASGVEKISFEAPTKLEYFRDLERIGKIEKPFHFKEIGKRAYLKVSTFSIYKNYIHEYHDILEKLKNFKEVVIDLRSNTGGSPSRARELIETLIKDETSVKKIYRIKVNPYSKDTLESMGLSGKEGEIVSKDVEVIYTPKGGFEGRVTAIVDRYTMGSALEVAYILKKAGYEVIGERPLQKLSRNVVFTPHGLPSAGFGIHIPDGRIENETDELTPDVEINLKDLEYIFWRCSGEDRILEKVGVKK